MHCATITDRSHSDDVFSLDSFVVQLMYVALVCTCTGAVVQE